MISAIGINLEMYDDNADRLQGPNVTPQLLVRLLIQILRLLGWRGRRAGDVLRSCYRRGVLPQPADCESYRAHVLLICLCHAADLANICYPKQLLFRFNLEYFLEDYSTTDRLLQIPFVELMRATKGPSGDSLVNLHRADGASFLVNDLDLGTLKVIGKLSVKWTMHCDEHMLLDVQQQQLLIAWFSPGLKMYQKEPVSVLFG